MVNKIYNKDSKVRVEWLDQPHNYSKEAKNNIKSFFANKYGFNKNNINVIYKPVKKNSKGELISVSGANLDNIMDSNYQRTLMKEYIERENKNIDFTKILALDDKVNSELTSDYLNTNKKNWSIKWISINNFLCFGENNFLTFSKLKGLVVVNSIPENQGGKCVRSDTKVVISYNTDEIIKKLGFLPDELK